MRCTLSLTLLAVTATTALAQPRQEPSFMTVTDVGKGTITFLLTVSATVEVQKTRTVLRDGKKVEVPYTEKVNKSITNPVTVSTEGLRLETVSGKKANWADAKGKVILRVYDPAGLQKEYRTLFKEETLVLIPEPDPPFKDDPNKPPLPPPPGV